MKKWFYVFGSIILAIGLCSGGYAYWNHPVSFLSVDINPSVELAVNAFDKVVDAKAYNTDGAKILEKQIISGDVSEAVATLIQSASEHGFIESDGSTIVAITAGTKDGKGSAADIVAAAEDGATIAIKNSGKSAVVFKDKVALGRRDEAKKLGITPGKLNLIQKLQVLDPAATVEQYKDAKIKDIMKKIVELKKAKDARVDDNETAEGINNSGNMDFSDIETAVSAVEENKTKGKRTTTVGTNTTDTNNATSTSSSTSINLKDKSRKRDMNVTRPSSFTIETPWKTRPTQKK